MTYELGIGTYATAWVGLTGTLFLMAKWLREKMGTLYWDFVSKIDGKNADLGLDRGIDPADIARDYLLPFGGGAIDTYTQQHDYSKRDYIAELDRDVGRPLWLIGFVAIFALALVVDMLGPVLFFLTGVIHAPEYFFALLMLMLINLIAYLIL